MHYGTKPPENGDEGDGWYNPLSKETLYFFAGRWAPMFAPVDRMQALESEVEALKAEVAHWKANHASMVEFNRQLRERPDLADRSASVEALRERAEKAEAQTLEARQLINTVNDTALSLDGECAELRAKVGEFERSNAALRDALKDTLLDMKQMISFHVPSRDRDRAMADYSIQIARVERILSGAALSTPLEGDMRKEGEP